MPVVMALLLWSCALTATETLNVRIGYLGPLTTDAHRGALQGLAEANAQGKFLGIHYELVPVTTPVAALGLPAVAVVADAPPDALSEFAQAMATTPVLNVTAGADYLRTVCGTNLFHVLPSDAMRADAVQQWKRHAPQSNATAQAWHPSFEKYAAAQLNKRYREAADKPMSDTAWAGWAAVKLVSASIAEMQSAASGSLLEQLQTRLAFDGQKGVDMSFRESGQLRQPLLLVEAGAIVGEAPVRGVAADEDLDSLGATACAK